MKKLLLAMIAFGGAMTSFAQDTTKEKTDTIKIGGMIIIKEKGQDGKSHSEVHMSNEKRKKKRSNLETNFGIVDIGFANIHDQTNYASAEAQAFALGIGSKESLNLKTKSNNVNVWFFMQKLNVVKHVVNLKYGLGLELNNYHWDDEQVQLTKNPTIIKLNPAYKDLDKNKLAADYLTVPMMINFNLTPKTSRGFGFSAGVSAGYLYSSRTKIKDGGHKDKVHDDFDLRRWKLSYIGELNLGPVRLYGSYAFKSMWDKGLDQTPYAVGFRISKM